MRPPLSSSNGPQRTMLASVKGHVQAWVNLVLYNSIYQNLFLLYLYKFFKFIYGLYDRSTELSRICCDPTSPLECLWDDQGQPTTALVNDKLGGTLAYAKKGAGVGPGAGVGFVGGSARRGSIQATAALLAPPSVHAVAHQRNNEDEHSVSTASASSARNSTESATLSSSSSEASSVPLESKGSDMEKVQGGKGTGHDDDEDRHPHHDATSPSELKMRKKKKRESSTSSTTSQRSTTSSASSNTSSNTTHMGSGKMDLRQSRAAAEMVYRIDRCILFSKQLTIERRELEAADGDPVEITQQILRKKRFPDAGSPHSRGAKKLQYALERIASTHQLAREINQRVHTKYDSTNPTHERKLMLLWDLMCPNEKLMGRYTKQWTEIGFQGKDPSTDFRGMGMLGLDDLVYYAKYYPQSSRYALECSHHEISWYSYAIVGINITAFAVQTLRTRQLQYYLFLNGTDRSVYHELYCYLFHRFNGYWSSLEPKPSIMDFERVFADFKLMMERQLVKRKLMMLRFDTKENIVGGSRTLRKEGGSGSGSGGSLAVRGNGVEEILLKETKKDK